jgi:hypothetical protein
MRAKESQKQKFDAAFGTILRISKCFQKSKQKLHIIFSLELGRKYWFDFYDFKKIIHLVTQSH